MQRFLSRILFLAALGLTAVLPEALAQSAADMAGSWSGRLSTTRGEMGYLHLENKGGKVMGTLQTLGAGGFQMDVLDVKLTSATSGVMYLRGVQSGNTGQLVFTRKGDSFSGNGEVSGIKFSARDFVRK